jgi:hypothetical protein
VKGLYSGAKDIPLVGKIVKLPEAMIRGAAGEINPEPSPFPAGKGTGTKFGGRASEDYSPPGGKGGGSAPRPMPGAAGSKLVQVQHLADMRTRMPEQGAPPNILNAQGMAIRDKYGNLIPGR